MLASSILIPLLATLVIASPAKRQQQQQQPAGLNALAKQHGKYIGTATNSFNLLGYNPGGAYLDILRREFKGALTAENEGKWDAIHPTPDQYNWTGMDAIVAEARQSPEKVFVRGHTFVWHAQTPAYINQMTDPGQLKSALKDHAMNVAVRYKNDWSYLDAINEPLNEDGTLRDSVWHRVLGEDYPEIALNIIHEAAPSIKLCINDYNIEGVNAKSKGMLAIAKKLLERGAPLHCIGFESHFIAVNMPQDIAASMQQFTDLGLEVPLTELDVRVRVTGNDQASSANLAVQANDYRTAVKTCLDNRLCPGVTVWQFYDPISWIPSLTPGRGAATPYDANFLPKPAYEGMREALAIQQ